MAALSAVRDPVLGRGLVELGLVRSVRARWGKVSVTVARASPGYPRSDELRRLVEEALRGLSGVKDVEVSLIDLVDSEAMTLAGILRSGAGGGIAGTS
ncbi:MAG: iron-sulfur cluster assembly protein, partial [Candidatus Dormibacteria bacterium]